MASRSFWGQERREREELLIGLRHALILMVCEDKKHARVRGRFGERDRNADVARNDGVGPLGCHQRANMARR